MGPTPQLNKLPLISSTLASLVMSAGRKESATAELYQNLNAHKERRPPGYLDARGYAPNDITVKLWGVAWRVAKKQAGAEESQSCSSSPPAPPVLLGLVPRWDLSRGSTFPLTWICPASLLPDE
ncbi:hypothetical protein FQN60_003449 [Etheostoma spectabile]|uniref:Uncharacterized protein n=1 Tax=Etheostoma spectabile TaxID=54343 RepID=A0A5J5CWU8_9PERO|nr:hypothetical protein FQN60_003449 [Etheostoma spectabile]